MGHTSKCSSSVSFISSVTSVATPPTSVSVFSNFSGDPVINFVTIFEAWENTCCLSGSD